MAVLLKTVSRKSMHQNLCQSDQSHIKDRMGLNFNFTLVPSLPISVEKQKSGQNQKKSLKDSSVHFKFIFVNKDVFQLNLTLSYLNSHHICRSNFIYRKNVSFNIFKRKKRVPIPCFHYFYHRRVTYRLMTHYTLEDYQKKRSGNHNAYSLPLSIPLSQGLPQ